MFGLTAIQSGEYVGPRGGHESDDGVSEKDGLGNWKLVGDRLERIAAS